MPRDDLPTEPDWLAKWKELPQNKPSKQALPPATGGGRWLLWLLAVVLLVAVIALLLQSRPM